MTDPSLPIAVAAVIVEVLRLSVFAYLWNLDRAEHLRWWTLGFLFYTVSQLALLTLLGIADTPWLFVIGLSGAVVATMLLLRGTLALVGRRVSIVWLLGVGCGAIAVAAVVAGMGAPNVVASIAPMGLLSLAHFVMAAALLVEARWRGGLGLWLSVGALTFEGVHFADYPILGAFPAVVPYGFALQLAASVAVGLGFTVLHLERARASQRAVELRYRELADALGVGVFEIDPAGRFTLASEALSVILGAKASASCEELDARRAELMEPGVWESLVDRLHREGQAIAVELALRTDRGEARPLELSARARRRHDGTIEGYRGFVLDRTEQRAVDARLREAQKLDAVGQLAAGIAHDFNNLLTILSATHDLLLASPLTAAQRSLVADADEAASQAARLTQRLLAFGRRQSTAPQRVDVAETVYASAMMVRGALGGRHRVALAVADGGLWVWIDPTQLEQVVLNLILNARDALPEGGVIHVEATAEARADRAGVRLIVRDEGVGMPPELRARAFEPFFSTKERGRGTGLGLATVHGIVVGSGGSIALDSVEGAGTTVRVWLPAAEGVASDGVMSGSGLAEAGASSGSGGAGASDAPVAQGAPVASSTDAPAEDRGDVSDKAKVLRALVADDEEVVRRLVGRLLEDAGYAVTTVASGNAAIALHDAGERFDVVVSDIRMPDGDGVSAARAVRRASPSTRIVLMSGYTEEVEADERLLCDVFLAKPFDREGLMRCVRGG